MDFILDRPIEIAHFQRQRLIEQNSIPKLLQRQFGLSRGPRPGSAKTHCLAPLADISMQVRRPLSRLSYPDCPLGAHPLGRSNGVTAG
jgi:hypothetical protein